MDKRAERHHEVDVLVAVDVPDVGAVPALENDRAGRKHRRSARRRVDTFDQRLLGALEPLLRAGTAAGRSKRRHVCAWVVDFSAKQQGTRRGPFVFDFPVNVAASEGISLRLLRFFFALFAVKSFLLGAASYLR